MRTLAMIKRVLLEMIRDKRTLALMFVAPLLILTLMYFLFQSNSNTVADLGVRNVDSSLVTAMKSKHVKLHELNGDQSAKTVIRKHDYAGVLSQSGDQLTLTLQNSDQSKSAILKNSLQGAEVKLKMAAAATTIKTQGKAMQQMSQQLAQLQKQINPNAQPQANGVTTMQHGQAAKTTKLHTHYLYGSSNSTFFNTLLPIMIGFVVFFFVFLISGIALLRERTTGTLYRLLATPVRRGEILTGYLSGYGLFALVQTILIVSFSVLAFKIQILGSVWTMLVINILLAGIALTLGLLISTFASSEFQMVQFIPVVVIPQVFFSGIIPIDQMESWLRPIAYIMPLYYGADSMSNVIEKGATIGQVAPNLLILLGFMVLFLILNLLAMRKYRQV